MKYEVVVIGAGPTGSTAAKSLAEKDVNVLLIDKKKFPRDKICGGSISSKILVDFKYLKNKNELFECTSSGGFVYSPSSKNVVKFKNDRSPSVMVLRDKFDMGLVNLSVDSGADFIDENGVKDFKILKDKAEVILEDGTKVETEFIIGADGVSSTVAKKSGLHQKWAPDEIATCVISEFNVGEDTVEEFYTENRFKHIHLRFGGIYGYAWVFPKKEHINIGLGEIRSKSKSNINLNSLFKEYIKKLKKDCIIPDNLKIDRLRGWPLPLKLPLKKNYTDRVILCGDAAGFVNPIDGGGIRYGMLSGKIAAEVISWGVKVDKLTSSGASRTYLSKYQKECKRAFGNEFKINLLIRNLVNMAPELTVKIASNKIFSRMFYQ